MKKDLKTSLFVSVTAALSKFETVFGNRIKSSVSLSTIIICTTFINIPVYGRPGDIDRTFGVNGIVRTGFTTAGQIDGSIYQADGKAIVVGEIFQNGSNQDFYAVRFNLDGTLDTTFGQSGSVAIAVSTRSDYAANVAVQPDGKILICGLSRDANSKYKFALVRLEPDGMLDQTFGVNGISITSISSGDDFASAVAVQDDMKILVAGSAATNGQNFALVRYDSDGSLDTTFNGTGKSVIRFPEGVSSAEAIAIDSGGKIVTAGATGGGDFSLTRFGLARCNPDGTLDTSFGNAGTVVVGFRNINQWQETAHALVLQPDDKIVALGEMNNGLVTGNDLAILRLNDNGSLDDSFGIGGTLITSIGTGDDAAYAAILQPDGKILVGGKAQYGGNIALALVRYDPDGLLDERFGDHGILSIDDPNRSEKISIMMFRPDGKLATAGFSRFEGVFLKFILVGTRESDFDNDGKTDISIFRPSVGAWYLLQSREGLYGTEFGFGDDQITPADFDGDGKTDISVYRPSTSIWYIFRSSDATVEYRNFGIDEDLPTPADYDGDGKADISVFRPSTATWYRQNSSDGSFYGQQFGLPEDKPTVGDFDGDGKADIAIFRPSLGDWYQFNSSSGSVSGARFGFGSDVIVPADYDGDGKTDLAVYRPSTGIWYINNSFTGEVTYNIFGLADDIPAPGDFDGDAKADVSVFRPSDGTWYRQNSSDGSFTAFQFGASGDKPTQTAFRY